MPNGKVAGMA